MRPTTLDQQPSKVGPMLETKPKIWLWALWYYSNDPNTATSGQVHQTYILSLFLSCSTSNLITHQNSKKCSLVTVITPKDAT